MASPCKFPVLDVHEIRIPIDLVFNISLAYFWYFAVAKKKKNPKKKKMFMHLGQSFISKRKLLKMAFKMQSYTLKYIILPSRCLLFYI